MWGTTFVDDNVWLDFFFRRQYRFFEKNIIVFYNCNFSSEHYSFWYMSPSLEWHVSNTFFNVTKNSWKPICYFLHLTYTRCMTLRATCRLYFRDISKISRLFDLRCNDMKILDVGIVVSPSQRLGDMNLRKYLTSSKIYQKRFFWVEKSNFVIVLL